jgi:short-subunit dehydrogenase
MNNLFFGGTSEIALGIANGLNDCYNISRKKNKIYKKNYIIKNYSEKELIKKIDKIKNIKFDNIVIFNGVFYSSFLSSFKLKEFHKILDINLGIPLQISKLCILKKILNKNGAIYFISSLAGTNADVGNALYAISKNALNFASKILHLEQKKRFVRVNTLLLGIVKNRMGNNLIQSIPLLKKNNIKLIKNNFLNKKILKILRNKKINGKSIKV